MELSSPQIKIGSNENEVRPLTPIKLQMFMSSINFIVVSLSIVSESFSTLNIDDDEDLMTNCLYKLDIFFNNVILLNIYLLLLCYK